MNTPPQQSHGESQGAKDSVAAPRDPLQVSPTHGGEIRDAQLSNGDGNKDGHGSGNDHGTGHGTGHGDEENVIPHDLPRPSPMALIILGSVFVVLLFSLFLIGLIPGIIKARETDAAAAARANDAPIVNTTQPVATATSKDVILPADIRAWASTMLYPPRQRLPQEVVFRYPIPREGGRPARRNLHARHRR